MLRSLTLALVALTAVSAPSLAQDPVQPFADATRVVVVGGSLLEMVYALGEEKRLVARDSTGVYPPEAQALPDVGYMRALSPEGVLAVNPTALLVVEGSGPPEALEVLSKGSVPYVTVPEDFSHAGILAKVRAVGAALGVPDKAEALAQKLDAELTAAEAATSAIPADERQRVLFVISAQDGKIRAAGSHTAANAIITLAGGINPLADMQGYQTLSDEALLAANPDVVLMMSNGGQGDFSADLAANPALAASPALTNGRILKLDGAYLLGFGPRTPAAILELAADLYGDRIVRP
ncbi:heme/hemin ABC transporter substrate-binding protein [Devosia sp.]|uniref:heme/hemin ABC transporter substrate-binding protein n=1 Tax=Devosia sp. TaxID=1871048 RepID=UPI003BAA6F52